MEENVIIAVGYSTIQFEQSLYTYGDNTLLATLCNNNKQAI